MQKKFLPTAVVFALGAAAMLLRKTEIDRVLTADGGFAVRGAAVSALLIALSVLAVVLSVAFAAVYAKKGGAPLSYSRAYRADIAAFSVASAASGAVVVAAAFMLDGSVGLRASGLPFAVFRCFAILTGISYASMALAQLRRKDDTLLYLTSVIPALFFCMWLAVFYKNNAGNPSLRTYMYGVLALSASAVAFYYAAGFVYGRAHARGALASNLAALYFVMLAAADKKSTAEELITVASAAFFAISAVRLTGGLIRSGKHHTKPDKNMDEKDNNDSDIG